MVKHGGYPSPTDCHRRLYGRFCSVLAMRRVVTLSLVLSACVSCSVPDSEGSSSEFEGAVGRNDVPAVVSMLRDGQDPNASPVLIALVRRGDVETIAALLAGGADPNITNGATNETPMHAAATREDEDAAVVFSMLLKAGGDPCRRIDPARKPVDSEELPIVYWGMSAVEIAERVGVPEVLTVIASQAPPCAAG